MTRLRPTAALAIFLALGSSAGAVLPDEIMTDPALEARARSLSAELRCMVCQNQSIDDSDAELARDLRILVRERILAGASDAEIRSFLVARYGEFVLLSPRLQPGTLLLWGAPMLILALAGGSLVIRSRKPQAAAAPLTAADEAELERLTREPG